MFLQGVNWFSEAGKTMRTELLCKKTFLLDGQTRQAKFSSQLVNLFSSWPFMNPLTTFIVLLCTLSWTLDEMLAFTQKTW